MIEGIRQSRPRDRAGVEGNENRERSVDWAGGPTVTGLPIVEDKAEGNSRISRHFPRNRGMTLVR